MREWLKRWLFKEEGTPTEDHRPAYDLLRNQGSIQAFKIANGYVVRVAMSDIYLANERAPNLHYCKDHQEIADYIVSQSAMSKLGIDQMELPLVGGQINAARLKANTTY